MNATLSVGMLPSLAQCTQQSAAGSTDTEQTQPSWQQLSALESPCLVPPGRPATAMSAAQHSPRIDGVVRPQAPQHEDARTLAQCLGAVAVGARHDTCAPAQLVTHSWWSTLGALGGFRC